MYGLSLTILSEQMEECRVSIVPVHYIQRLSLQRRLPHAGFIQASLLPLNLSRHWVSKKINGLPTLLPSSLTKIGLKSVTRSVQNSQMYNLKAFLFRETICPTVLIWFPLLAQHVKVYPDIVCCTSPSFSNPSIDTMWARLSVKACSSSNKILYKDQELL